MIGGRNDAAAALKSMALGLRVVVEAKNCEIHIRRLRHFHRVSYCEVVVDLSNGQIIAELMA